MANALPPLLDSAGLSPIEAHGASEKCTKASGSMHISCTVFPHALDWCNFTTVAQFERQFYKHFTATKNIAPPPGQKVPEENSRYG
jgi:hypothetical protein